MAVKVSSVRGLFSLGFHWPRGGAFLRSSCTGVWIPRKSIPWGVHLSGGERQGSIWCQTLLWGNGTTWRAVRQNGEKGCQLRTSQIGPVSDYTWTWGTAPSMKKSNTDITLLHVAAAAVGTDDVVPWVAASIQESQSGVVAEMSAGTSSEQLCTKKSNLMASTCREDAIMSVILVAGSQVEAVAGPGISSEEFRQALDSVPFKQWIKSMEGPAGLLIVGDGGGGGRISLKRVLFQSIDFFGKRVGFVKFKADVVDKETGSKLPGIVFARGGAVGILMLLESDSQMYAVLTEQVRVPVGRSILELPAGMLDDGVRDFVGTAAREVEEETGIHIRGSELIDLTALLDESSGRKMFPSPGGCDEDITLFLYRGKVSKEVIEQLQGRETGLRDHGELIKVHVVPYARLWRISPDAKVLAAIAIYEMALREGILPPTPPVSPPSSPHPSHP